MSWKPFAWNPYVFILKFDNLLKYLKIRIRVLIKVLINEK
jgi:hypothetical protein